MIRELCDVDYSVETKIEKRILRRFEHVERMIERYAKQIYKASVSEPVGKG